MLHVISDNQRRGAQVFAHMLAGRLDDLGLDNHVVALIGRPGGLDVPILGPRARGPATLRALRRRMAGVDVTVAHGSSTLQACGLAGLGPGRQFIYRQISDPVYWSSALSQRLRTRAFYRLPTHVVSLSDRTTAVLVNRYRMSPERISVIPNAVDDTRFFFADEDARRAARQLLELDDSASVIAFVGALSREKGVFDLLDAALPGTVVVMAGEGPAATQLRAKAFSSQAELRMLGSVDNTKAVYAAADVVVLPSWSEQQPAAILEAALVGTPVVSTDVGLISELLPDARSRELVPPRNPRALREAIARFLEARDKVRVDEITREWITKTHGIHVIAADWRRLLLDVSPADDQCE